MRENHILLHTGASVLDVSGFVAVKSPDARDGVVTPDEHSIYNFAFV